MGITMSEMSSSIMRGRWKRRAREKKREERGDQKQCLKKGSAKSDMEMAV